MPTDESQEDNTEQYITRWIGAKCPVPKGSLLPLVINTKKAQRGKLSRRNQLWNTH